MQTLAGFVAQSQGPIRTTVPEGSHASEDVGVCSRPRSDAPGHTQVVQRSGTKGDEASASSKVRHPETPC
jgi:hypothetical protein